MRKKAEKNAEAISHLIEEEVFEIDGLLNEFDVKDVIDIGSPNARVSKFVYSAAAE